MILTGGTDTKSSTTCPVAAVSIYRMAARSVALLDAASAQHARQRPSVNRARRRRGEARRRRPVGEMQPRDGQLARRRPIRPTLARWTSSSRSAPVPRRINTLVPASLQRRRHRFNQGWTVGGGRRQGTPTARKLSTRTVPTCT